jgi:hypothetical protein
MTTIGSLEGDSNNGDNGNNGNKNYNDDDNKDDDDGDDEKKEYAFQIESEGGPSADLSQLTEQYSLVRKILIEIMVKTLI